MFTIQALAKEPLNYKSPTTPKQFLPNRYSKIGDYPFPTNPMTDRARGYLIQGKVKNAITNYGNFINWDEHPAGLWGQYAYLPAVSMLAGLPGQMYSSKFNWNIYESIQSGGAILRQTWQSSDAYNAWFTDGDTNFVGILFDANDDYGNWRPDSLSKIDSPEFVYDFYQWGIDEDDGSIFISVAGETGPNKSNSRIGLIYP